MFVYRMAPKARKPATKKEGKTEVEIMSESRHNMIAYLDPNDELTDYAGIMKWLRDSRIHYAITHKTPVFRALIKEFWDTAVAIEIDGKEAVRGTVKGVEVVVTAEVLNNVLQLNDDPNAPSIVNVH